MAKFTITAYAKADLWEIYTYIARDKPDVAQKFIRKLRLQARALANAPRLGRSREVDLLADIYSFPVGNYILFYKLQPGGIILIRVLHGSRDLHAIFEDLTL